MTRQEPGGYGKVFVVGARQAPAILASFCQSWRMFRNSVFARQSSPGRLRVGGNSCVHLMVRIASAKSGLPAPSMSGNYGGLDVAVTVQHVPQNLRQPGKRRLSGNVVIRADLLFGNKPERAANCFRRVMESRLQSDLRVMKAIGVELHFGAAGATTEKVYRSAFTHHVNGPLPGFRAANRFDHNVGSA